MKEKQNSKKWRFVKSIFKWLFIVLLALLLLAGLIFRAPWKVLALLAIFLMACTVLPKPARKWFWISIGVLVIALVVWIFLPEDDKGWRPYTFDEELARLNAKYAVPDEDNAAVIYNKLIQTYDGDRFIWPDFNGVAKQDINDFSSFQELVSRDAPPKTFYPDFWDKDLDNLTLFEQWSSGEYPELAEWLKAKHKTTIEALMLASTKEVCRFTKTIDIFSTSESDRLSAMSDWVKLLIRAANNDRGDNRIDLAVEKYVSALRMANLVLTDEIMLGCIIYGQITRPLNRLVVTDSLKTEHLDLLDKEVKDIDFNWRTNLLRMIEYDKLKLKNIWAMFYEINAKGKTRLSRGLSQDKFDKKLNIDRPQIPFRKQLIKLGTIFVRFWVPSSPNKLADIIDASYEKYYAAAEPGYGWDEHLQKPYPAPLRFNFAFMIRLMFQPRDIHDIYLVSMARKRATQIIIALKRYKNKQGHWPESLEGIKSLASSDIFVDPINDGDFVYRLTEENFTLYSRDENNIDEKGERGIKEQDGTRLDDTLFWPQNL